MHPLPTLLRPQCNSIMHLFGKWLLDAALASCKFDSQGEKFDEEFRTSPLACLTIESIAQALLLYLSALSKYKSVYTSA